MSDPSLLLSAAHPAPRSPRPRDAVLATLPLPALARRIAAGDREALEELWAHRHPLEHRGQAMGMAAWIDRYAGILARDEGGGDAMADAIRDPMIDRFGRLPRRPGDGVDCRHTYAAFVQHLPPPEPGRSPLEAHHACLHRFRGLVRYHLRLCGLEARRSRSPQHIAHAVDGRVLYVPRCVRSADRDGWLAETFEPLQPDRPGDLERLQAEIDAWSARRLIDHAQELAAACRDDPLGEREADRDWSDEWSATSLGEAVAREKAATPDRQRAAIRALGPQGIADLVRSVMADLAAGEYRQAATARRFGLHPSTLSRFAAARWTPASPGVVPDLYRNAAQLLSRLPEFEQRMAEAGVANEAALTRVLNGRSGRVGSRITPSEDGP